MAEFNFKDYLFNKGFSFTNEGKEQFFHKEGNSNKIIIKGDKIEQKGDKIEQKGEILDFPKDEKSAEEFLKVNFGDKEPKKQEKTENKDSN